MAIRRTEPRRQGNVWSTDTAQLFEARHEHGSAAEAAWESESRFLSFSGR